MPSLPFTFEDLRKLDIPAQAAAAEASDTPQVDPQEFLGNAVDRVKKQFGTTDGLIDTGLAINPITRVVDMGSKFFGGPGVAEGFKQGVIQEVGDPRAGRSQIVLPPMPF